MKNLLFIAISLFLYACSSENSNDENENPLANLNFIRKVENDAPNPWDTGDNFYYKNEKLQFIETKNCSGLNYYFEYGGNNLVSKRYRFEDINFDINTVNIEEITSQNQGVDYIYENNKLIRFEIDGIPFKFLTYNENGQLSEFEFPNNSKQVISYDGDVVSEIILFNLSSGNSVTYTFEFDDKVNPLYALYSEFGIIDVEICRSLEDVLLFRDLPVFKNNATRVFKDGVLVESASYQYIENNIPIRVISTIPGEEQVSEFFTYQ